MGALAGSQRYLPIEILSHFEPSGASAANRS
jgi:hypothetical protein